MPQFVSELLFVVSSVVAIAGGLFAVTRRNAIYAVLGLIAVFLAIAVIYGLLDATFLAVGQVIVYAGAILMLFLFVVMLFDLGRTPGPDSAGGRADPETLARVRAKDPVFDLRALIMSAGLLVLLAIPMLMAGDSVWAEFPAADEHGETLRGSASPPRTLPVAIEGGEPDEVVALATEYGTPERVGFDMFDRYLVPFELVSLIILVGIIAAVVLAKKRSRPETEALAAASDTAADADANGSDDEATGDPTASPDADGESASELQQLPDDNDEPSGR